MLKVSRFNDKTVRCLARKIVFVDKLHSALQAAVLQTRTFGMDPDPEFDIRPYGSGSLPVYRMSEEHLCLANF